MTTLEAASRQLKLDKAKFDQEYNLSLAQEKKQREKMQKMWDAEVAANEVAAQLNEQLAVRYN
jgi:hypothetical protein